MRSALRFLAGKMRVAVLPFPERPKPKSLGEAKMTKESDIVILADVRSKLTAARPMRLTIVEVNPTVTYKTCEVLMFTGRTMIVSGIKP